MEIVYDFDFPGIQINQPASIFFGNKQRMGYKNRGKSAAGLKLIFLPYKKILFPQAPFFASWLLTARAYPIILTLKSLNRKHISGLLFLLIDRLRTKRPQSEILKKG
jgi:hypothetical protein